MNAADKLGQLEGLLGQLEQAGDDAVVELTRQAIACVLDFHHHGLTPLWAALDPARQEELTRNPAIRALLLVHGLHPEPVEDRIAQAIDDVRASQRAVIAVKAASATEVRVHIAGTGRVIAMALERALLELAPDAGPLSWTDDAQAAQLIPIGRLVGRQRAREETSGELGPVAGPALSGPPGEQGGPA